MLTIGSFVWGVRDIPRALELWTNALDYVPRDEPEIDWVTLIPRVGTGPRLSLMLVTSDKPARHHLDLLAENQAAEVERMLALGASPVEWDYPEDADYVVLDDPHGNRFCVVQAPAAPSSDRLAHRNE